MNGLDEYITAFDDREPEEQYRIRGHEDEGSFGTYQSALKYIKYIPELKNVEVPDEYIYMEGE